MRKSTHLLFFLAITTLPQMAATAGPGWKGPAFSAEQVEFNRHTPGNMTTSRVYVSATGMRIESGKGTGAFLVAVTNYEKGKAWIALPERKLMAESALHKGADAVPAKGVGVIVSGLLDPAPCGRYDLRKELGAKTVSGRKTVKWACGDSRTKTTVLQWYDPALRAVIREETQGGDIGELRKIKLGAQPRRLFVPPSGYRKVAMEQLLPGVPVQTYR